MALLLAALFVLGAGVASLLNAAIYAWAWTPRRVSPWQATPEGVAPRGWADCLPIFGWLRLRRDAGVLGAGFWVRPMLIEVGFGLALATLYWWEVGQQGLILGQLPFATTPQSSTLAWTLNWQFVAHGFLLAMMVIATFIDFDEQTIPDLVTWPGLWVGLILATLVPTVLLPNVEPRPAMPAIGVAIMDANNAQVFGKSGDPLYLEPVTSTAPNAWPELFAGKPNRTSLAIGLGCWWLWCFAVAYRPWRRRASFSRNLRACTARLLQSFRLGWMNKPAQLELANHQVTWQQLMEYRLLEISLLGTLLIAMVWYGGGASWTGLLSALIGMVGSGGIVWAVRIIGSWALGREAMGFGDVTLMMMVGAFLGWQAGLMIFFLAPFAGIILGLLKLLLRGDKEIPYGPFLCLAAAAVVVRWAGIWDAVEHFFAAGLLVPAVMVVCLAMLAVMLGLLQLAKRAFGG